MRATANLRFYRRQILPEHEQKGRDVITVWVQPAFFWSPLREISASANLLADAALNCSAGTAQLVMDVTAMQPSEKWLKTSRWQMKKLRQTTTNVKRPLR